MLAARLARDVQREEDLIQDRFASAGFRSILTEAGFPPTDTAELTILRPHAIEPPL